jgi:hypothetical protein
LAAIERRQPDRAPVDFWASGGFKEKVARQTGVSWEEFLDEWDVDLRYIDGPAS